eukprot:CAMPEP_0204832696 /NCGR_PEP_ID=MMETSP1346-20131115/14442_1 /ASSEMBLY_ACC=CAM_ASM_000771 /TAXON_ID=215587 /ORGANISM="Aplanochytrium stocchinoi, Strain GSBS06" /LENGTH=207 /DNA_ID=CAMNT_0051964673 /DNA_START=212 /DNA_END=835 /DNA_ORIENTATION=+
MKENNASTENSLPETDGKKRKAKSNQYPKDVTVEEYLNQHCEQIVKDVQGHASSLADQLQEEYEELKQLVLSNLERKKTASTKIDGEDDTPSNISVQLFVEAGPYKGRRFEISVCSEKPCLVGRSRGVKFRHGGISLPRDGEVSTTHGKLELDTEREAKDQIVFTDVGSTNGTFVNGEAIEANDPISLHLDDILLCGATPMKIVSIS